MIPRRTANVKRSPRTIQGRRCEAERALAHALLGEGIGPDGHGRPMRSPPHLRVGQGVTSLVLFQELLPHLLDLRLERGV